MVNLEEVKEQIRGLQDKIDVLLIRADPVGKIEELQEKIDGLLDSIEASKIEEKLDEVLRVQKGARATSRGRSVRKEVPPENGKMYRGFRLYQKPGYTSSSGVKFYWHAYRHFGAKLKTVYVGADPGMFESKVDAWLSKRPSLEAKAGE